MAAKKRTSSRKSTHAASPAKRAARQRDPVVAGQQAQSDSLNLRSYDVGALPLVNGLLERMRLREFLLEHLPPDDPRTEFPTVTTLLVLVRNVLLARQPVYGVAEWAARFAPDLLGLQPTDVHYLHDDRIGRCLDRLFERVGPPLVLAIVRHVVQEFAVGLDELHNDSTTISFYGAYEEAEQAATQRGSATAAITWGHSKDHRPDLKQLLYTLTISEDGGIPLYFTTSSGNTADDTTHRATWDLLRELVGHAGFLYVADCKLASGDNLAHIAVRGGRFVTILPRTHREDGLFRERLRRSDPALTWQPLYAVSEEDGTLRNQFSVCTEEQSTHDGYRLLWIHSTRKAELDGLARQRRVQRAQSELRELQAKLHGPRTRFREYAKVTEAVQRILAEHEVESLVRVEIQAQVEETFRQIGPGRPTEATQYRKETRPAYAISWELDAAARAEAERQDGVFPLLTNDRTLSAEQVLRAYKRQPFIERRFSQFKNDFAVAPVYLKNVARIQGLLAVYFFVLLTQTLLERELRRGMAKTGLTSLPLYPEGRRCARPTTPRLLELFEPVQRHVLRTGASPAADADRQAAKPSDGDEKTAKREPVDTQDATGEQAGLTDVNRAPAEKSNATGAEADTQDTTGAPAEKSNTTGAERHEAPRGEHVMLTTLTPLQQQILELLGLPHANYGR